LRIIALIARFLLGSAFVFSGMVKLIDPKGTQIKLQEYFVAFGKISEHYLGSGFASIFEFLMPTTLILALVLCVLEVVLGLAILLWYRPKKTLWTSFGLLIFFAFLTGYSANCDPHNPMGVSCVTDCGCFGDFLKLKPIHSFYKDLIFLALNIPLLLLAIKEKPSEKSSKSDFEIIGFASALLVVFGIYNTVNEPIIDFRPYKIGNNLIELKKDYIPAEIEYLISVDGKETQVKQLPQNQKYQFIKVIEVEPEKPATIHDFYLFTTDGKDVTDSILNEKVDFVIFKSIEDFKNNFSDLDRLKAQSKNIAILTSQNLETVKKKLVVDFPIFAIDETVLKAITRNYPSLVRLEKGIVIDKKSLSKI
jgi:uncharacterized membrane protein YphA (DoxX/SURF4 family)